jgi:hypothetical protein
MTRQKWEYASVTWTETARKITKSDPEFERLSSEVQQEWNSKGWGFYWWKTHTFYIKLPGATEADSRVSWETTEEHRFSRLEILNELGADGWEVTSSEVQYNALGPSYGRETTSFPIRIYMLLKRPVEA